MLTLFEQIERIAARHTDELPIVYWVEPRPRCYKCGANEVMLAGDFCDFCTQEQKQGYEALTMTGRCANGAQRDGGTLYHAVMAGQWKAVCGATHGRRSRWSEYHGAEVTCKRCLKKMESK